MARAKGDEDKDPKDKKDKGPKDSGSKEKGPKDKGPKDKGPKEDKGSKGPKDTGSKEKGSKDKGPKDKDSSGAPKRKAATPRLQTKYQQEILPVLAEKLGRVNRLSLPRIQKITVNMGVGEAKEDKKFLELATDALGLITGQKPIITIARKSVAGFKLREGQQIGCKVTLRRQRMYEFFDRLISLALPRVRDFRGLNPKGFDGNGNYNMGLTEQLVFPEINPDKFTKVQGMNITIVTTARNDDEAHLLLTAFGMPFRQSGSSTEAA